MENRQTTFFPTLQKLAVRRWERYYRLQISHFVLFPFCAMVTLPIQKFPKV